MDTLNPTLRPTHPVPAGISIDATATADGLAKRFFVLTMIGIVVYVSAILLLLSSGLQLTGRDSRSQP